MYQVFSLNSKESAFRNNDSTIPWLLSAWKCDVLLHQRTLIKNNIKKKEPSYQVQMTDTTGMMTERFCK